MLGGGRGWASCWTLGALRAGGGLWSWVVTSPSVHELVKSCCCQVGVEARFATGLCWQHPSRDIKAPLPASTGRKIENQLPAWEAYATWKGNQNAVCFAREKMEDQPPAQPCWHHRVGVSDTTTCCCGMKDHLSTLPDWNHGVRWVQFLGWCLAGIGGRCQKSFVLLGHPFAHSHSDGWEE